ncbi:MAG: hypothetical protein Tsb009_08000 [Planctomycetaceae bacterium]
MRRFLLTGLTRYPATAGILLIAVTLFTAVTVYDLENPRSKTGGVDVLGGISHLKIPANSQLHGPLNFWGTTWLDGEWWRVTISGFHHLGLFHLLMNGAIIALLGYFLERRMGHWRYLLFFVVATTVSLLPCFLREWYVIGLSGGAFALFGLILGRCEYDEEFRESLPDGFIAAGILGLFGGFLSNAVGFMEVSNLGHASGLIYGWVAGRSLGGHLSYPKLRRTLFFASHLLIPVSLFLATHPFWNGRYHWYLAEHAESAETRFAHLQQAVTWDPSLSGAWRELATYHSRNGDEKQALRAIFRSLYYHRSDKKSMKLVSRIWSGLRTAQQKRTALQIFEDVFGEESSAWQSFLGLTHPRASQVVAKRKTERPPQFLPGLIPGLHRWIVRPGGVDLFWPPIDADDSLIRLNRPLTVDPNDPQSAVLGRTL